jgi:hypothetical protein
MPELKGPHAAESTFNGTRRVLLGAIGLTAAASALAAPVTAKVANAGPLKSAGVLAFGPVTFETHFPVSCNRAVLCRLNTGAFRPQPAGKSGDSMVFNSKWFDLPDTLALSNSDALCN